MDSDQGKLFVGGIPFETTEDTLKDHFGQYGEVIESVIMKDRSTGKVRGFGFVQFSDQSAADKALTDKHAILGRTVEVKKAIPRGQRLQKNHQHHPNDSHQQQDRGLSRSNYNNGDISSEFRTKKIFVGGLSADLTEQQFKSYFERFGGITDVVVMYDSATHRPRGFGFITFDSEEAVDLATQNQFHDLNNKQVEVKRAVPKEGNNGSNKSFHSNSNGNSNYNDYNMVVPGFGRGVAAYGMYTPYGANGYYIPGYMANHSITSFFYSTSMYNGAYYPTGGYCGVGYGAGPRISWNGPGVNVGNSSPMLCVNAGMYNGNMSLGAGGVMDVVPAGYNGIMGPAVNGNWDQGNWDQGIFRVHGLSTPAAANENWDKGSVEDHDLNTPAVGNGNGDQGGVGVHGLDTPTVEVSAEANGRKPDYDSSSSYQGCDNDSKENDRGLVEEFISSVGNSS